MAAEFIPRAFADISGTVSTAQLPDSGATPGTYANATVQVDRYGRVIAAGAGTPNGVVTVAGRAGAVVLTSADLADLPAGLASFLPNNGDGSNVTTTAGRAGEISLTLAARMLDAVGVKSFGAAGDGTTDDTAAITAAFAAAAGKPVDFPPGTYVVSSAVVPLAGTTVRGWGATLKLKSSSTATPLSLQNPNVTVLGLTVDGNKAGQTATPGCIDILADNCTVHQCKSLNSANYGVFVSANNARFTGGYVLNSANVAVFPQASAADLDGLLVEGNTIDRTGVPVTNFPGGGVQVHALSGKYFYGVRVANNRVALPHSPTGGLGGICIEGWRDTEAGPGGCPGMVVTGNVTDGGSMGVSFGGCDGASVIGNTIIAPITMGVESGYSQRVTITGNTIDGAGLLDRGVCTDGHTTFSSGTVIANNSVTGLKANGSAVYFYGGSNNTLNGNTLNAAGTGVSGIYNNGAAYCNVVGNVILGGTTGAWGVQLFADHQTVTGNTVTGFLSGAMYVGTQDYLTIGDNALDGNNGVRISGTPGSHSSVIDGTLTGVLKGTSNGTVVPAVGGTDYVLPAALATTNSNVATNTTNIATNTSAISANTTALAAKAPLASPALTGTPTAPTAAAGTNTTQLATTAFVLANASTKPYVLDFPAGSAQSVGCGPFWPATTNLGSCFYRAVVMPRDSGGGYVFSDGYGGAHAVLFGFSQSGAGTLNLLTGNVSGTPGTSYTASDGLYPNEWGEIAWGWDGANMWCYVNGIPVLKAAYAGTRQSPAAVAGGGGDLFLGGSTHSNFNGRMAAAAVFENAFPIGSYPQFAYYPDYPLMPYHYDGNGVWTPVSGAWQTVNPTQWVVPDLSPSGTPSAGAALAGTVAVTNGSAAVVGTGTAFTSSVYPGKDVVVTSDGTGKRYTVGSVTDDTHLTLLAAYTGTTNASTTATVLGPKITHPGYLYGTSGAAARGWTYAGASSYPRPSFVQDSTFPFQSPATLPTPPGYFGPAAPSTPTSAKVFDSFTRANQTLAWDATPTLGSTESGGSLGALAWSAGNPAGAAATPWGILHGRAVFLGSNVRSVAWVTSNSADMDVRVDRLITTAGVGNRVALAFRVQDRQNFWYLQAAGGTSGTDQAIVCGTWVAGSNTFEVSVGAVATNWSTLRVVTSGTTFTVYVDNGAGGWTQVGSPLTGKTALQSATGAGLLTPTTTGTPGVSGLDRWDNFTVL